MTFRDLLQSGDTVSISYALLSSFHAILSTRLQPEEYTYVRHAWETIFRAVEAEYNEQENDDIVKLVMESPHFVVRGREAEVNEGDEDDDEDDEDDDEVGGEDEGKGDDPEATPRRSRRKSSKDTKGKSKAGGKSKGEGKSKESGKAKEGKGEEAKSGLTKANKSLLKTFDDKKHQYSAKKVSFSPNPFFFLPTIFL
jgi:hypothetical protein